MTTIKLDREVIDKKAQDILMGFNVDDPAFKNGKIGNFTGYFKFKKKPFYNMSKIYVDAMFKSYTDYTDKESENLVIKKIKKIEKIKILFWKIIAIVWDTRPRMHLPKYCDYPIASCDIANKYNYPPDYKILYEWDEKGKHWIVFSRRIEYF